MSSNPFTSRYIYTHTSCCKHLSLSVEFVQSSENHIVLLRQLKMSSQQEKAELDARAKHGETVVPGGTGGKSLEAQEHLAEGNTIFLLDESNCYTIYSTE